MAKHPDTVQVPYSLFMDLCRYHLYGLDDPDLLQRIHIGLQEKADRQTRRETYIPRKDR